jgi:ketosteroid isomerase-like protein
METHIIELEKEYWRAMENRDFTTIKRLTRFPCIVAGKNGIREVDEPTFKAMFDSSENMQLKIIEISSTATQVIGEQTAVIAYRITMEYSIEGKNSPFNCACTSTWIKEDGQWVCVMHTETELAK